MERPVSMMARRSPTPSTIISESTVQSLKRHTESLKLVTQKRDSGTKRKRQVKAYFCEERHKSNATPETNRTKVAHWRMKERMKTVSVALVLALNIGVDPPDVLKPSPCARMECWIDVQQHSAVPAKALEQVGKQLQAQYERWQPRARYKQSLDPTVDDVKKLCVSLRRNAKDERVLFHYNGHGVPRPTNNGEIWVFNKNYTQYIPLSIYDLQTWLGSPAIYVFDCNAAGMIVKWFSKFAQQREEEYQRIMSSARKTAHTPPATMNDCVLLAACREDELLPMNPELPADIFTACLTTPIKMALRWFCSHSILSGVTPAMIDRIPGRLNDRRTPLGELNWIFTAITDTIAWNVLPPDLFQKLFRQDLLVASLFRNFLLAERIMRSCNCTPISSPALPPTYQHPMWQAWDLAADICLSQLPAMLEDPSAEFKHNPFFAEQLTAFEVWLEFGSEDKKPPEQLPIVLQVLLSQAHRLRALQLLARFLDLGPWAVNLALSVGIFPYVLKLLQSPAPELRAVLVFIWAKILALDKSCQMDLVKDAGQNYFIQVLSFARTPATQRTMAAFVLTVIMNNCQPGQCACLSGNLLPIALNMLTDGNSNVRKWGAFCLGKLWEDFEDAKWAGIKAAAHERLCALLTDASPEVRGASVFALGTLLGGSNGNEQRREIELNIGVTLPVVMADGSPMVRKELIVALANLVRAYESDFVAVAVEMYSDEFAKEEERARLMQRTKEASGKRVGSPGNASPHIDRRAMMPPPPPPPSTSTPSTAHSLATYACLWRLMLTLRSDPFPALAHMTRIIVSSIHQKVKLASPQAKALIVSREEAEAAAQAAAAAARDQLRRKQPDRRNRLSLATFLSPAQAASQSSSSSSSSGSLSNSASTATTTTASSAAAVAAAAAASLQSSEAIAEAFTDADGCSLLQSTLYQWSCQYFSKPNPEDDLEDPTAPEVIQTEWRQMRQTSMLEDLNTVAEKALRSKFDSQVSFLDHEAGTITSVLFHPFENILVSSDDQDIVSVWNWSDNTKLNTFSNGARVTSMKLVNDNHQQVMLLTGSDDGVVRCWRNFTQATGALELASSWRALNDLSSNGRVRGAGLVLHWCQADGWLMASGDVPIIRVWDMEKDLSIQDIPTGGESCVTQIVQDKTGNSRLFVVGCGDGSLRAFDCRAPPRFMLVQNFNEHKNWVVNVDIPTLTKNRIISGSVGGDVKIWDIRSPNSQATFQMHTAGEMTAMAVHDHARIIATGIQNQKIKVSTLDGKELSLIKYHEGFLGQRIGPVSCLAFHPYRLILAAGATDSIVSMYQSHTIL